MPDGYRSGSGSTTEYRKFICHVTHYAALTEDARPEDVIAAHAWTMSPLPPTTTKRYARTSTSSSIMNGKGDVGDILMDGAAICDSLSSDRAMPLRQPPNSIAFVFSASLTRPTTNQTLGAPYYRVIRKARRQVFGITSSDTGRLSRSSK